VGGHDRGPSVLGLNAKSQGGRRVDIDIDSLEGVHRRLGSSRLGVGRGTRGE